MTTHYLDLLVGPSKQIALADFSRFFFEISGLPDFERRESDNYVSGYYFIARDGPKVIRVMLSDSDDANDLPFWIQIMTTDDRALSIAEVDAIAHSLLRSNYRVVRVTGFGRHDETRVEFQREH